MTHDCHRCDSCTQVCPLVGRSDFPGPRMVAIDLPRTVGADGRMTLCTTCASCEEACPSGVPLVEMMLEERRRAFQEGSLADGHRRLLANIEATGLSVSGDPLPPGGEGEVVLFPGCIQSVRAKEDARAARRALEVMGMRATLPELVCCGAPLTKVGAVGRARELAERNADTIAGRRVVTACPGCTEQLHMLGEDVRHMVEVMYDGMRRPSLRFKGCRERVAMHHPCHLARRVGRHAIDQAYELLAMVPGLEVVEMDDPDRCCGGGGGVMSGHPWLAEAMANEKVEDARRNGAERLLAACPFCVLNLGRAGGMQVTDLTRFLADLISGAR